jgi:transcriptional regulator with XRE-family HTH domain
MITPAQCRAARALLGWTIRDLAERTGLAASTINRFEMERNEVTVPNRATIDRAMKDAGLEFGSPESVILITLDPS